MKMSDKLIELRKEKGWSQEDFAEKLDVSRQAISRWENGIALPDAQNILRISKLFHVTADYLLNDDYQGEVETSAVEAAAETVETAETAEATEATQATEDTTSVSPKKKFLYWYFLYDILWVEDDAVYFIMELSLENFLKIEGSTSILNLGNKLYSLRKLSPLI